MRQGEKQKRSVMERQRPEWGKETVKMEEKREERREKRRK
jgi:hypothetical protein